MPGGPGLLSDLLHQLDVPSDVRLVSVSTSIDPVDGATVWTVQYKQTLPGQQQYPAAAPSRPKVIAPSHSMPQSPRAGPTAPLSPSHMPRDLNIEIPPSMSIQSLGGGSVMRVPPSPTPATAMRCFPLKCIVQTYAWGKIGLDSAVARLAAEGINDDIPIEEYTPYAELWMGTHPVGPSLVVLENPWKSITPLSDWLKLNPVMAGSQGLHGHIQVPFLFKVLSVRTALSIQAHPDKALARELHHKRSDLYKDDNHKPEMAIAITPFEALCGFQRATSIVANCMACPELIELVGEDRVSALDQAATSSDDIKPALRDLFTVLMTAPAHIVETKLTNLMTRIDATNEMLRMPVDTLAQRIHAQYPGDVGVFCVYLLNYVCLKPGEAVFMAANEPHAYLYGDCVECMACSDNVVRAGLTPKFKDTATLCDMLTYNDGPIELYRGQPIGKFVSTYIPPPAVDEFRLERCQLPPNSACSLKAVDGVSIIVVINGAGIIEEVSGHKHPIKVGSVMLVCAGSQLNLRTRETESLLAFRAMARDV